MNDKTRDTTISLQGHFLIATPGLHDPVFANTVIYLCEHTRYGAMGLVVNQPLDISLNQIFEQFELNYSEPAGKLPLLSGGPVQVNRGFVLHRPQQKDWEATQKISPDIHLTSSRDIIEDIANDKGPEDSLITLGYAGWEAGQLEAELGTNAWLAVPAKAEILFDTAIEDRAHAAAATIGVNLHQFGSTAGHA
ncbi:MAG: YqgE/AlgH family protein [Porticoccaceae bacterium]|nr:YqgE/AlgH family protein [Pseudomonadales bacterium]MCP5173063.1 YqgE/AlgH family protein [Pseudomonadales bacterium]MCP5302537.1 YqgE/AlgH family protein [Pseudomonadales bacterium]